MYDAKVASLRDHGYDLETIWNLPRTKQLQEEIWNYKCPQCWTPCEAYQSIFGNFLRRKNMTSALKQNGKPATTDNAPSTQETPLVQIGHLPSTK
jgi:hypothetical protein